MDEEIADLYFSAEETTPDAEEADADALEQLKRRYATGEIDDEFEHRLERLVAVDDLPNDVFAAHSSSATAGQDEGLDREAERERKQ